MSGLTASEITAGEITAGERLEQWRTSARRTPSRQRDTPAPSRATSQSSTQLSVKPLSTAFDFDSLIVYLESNGRVPPTKANSSRPLLAMESGTEGAGKGKGSTEVLARVQEVPARAKVRRRRRSPTLTGEIPS